MNEKDCKAWSGTTVVAQCELCKSEIRLNTPSDWIVRAVRCEACGECTAVGAPPPNNMFSRCPYCMYLMVHPVHATTAVCPRMKCKRKIQLSPRTQVPPEVSLNNSLQICGDRIIGYGGFGTVYSAVFKSIQCSVKVFDVPRPSAGEKVEKSTVSTLMEIVGPFCILSHPNLMKYLEVTSDPTSHYPAIALEFVKGALSNFLGNLQNPLPLHVQLDFSHSVALALSYLHEKGIIHGNLSSQSVYLTEKGQVKVSDYEVLGVYPFIAVEHMESHSLPYVPPEAFSTPTVRSGSFDIFSWSVLVLQIITRLFPNPDPRLKEVTDPHSLSARPIQVSVSEISRRKSHIDLVDDSNPLLSVLVLGLDDVLEKRPTTAEVIDMVSLVKLSEEHQESQSKAGIDWIERHMFVFDYELVKILEKPQPNATARSHMVEKAVSEQSFQEEGIKRTEGKMKFGMVEGCSEADERYEGVLFIDGMPVRKPGAILVPNEVSPAPPVYSEVCCSTTTSSAEDIPSSAPPPYILLPEEHPLQLKFSIGDDGDNEGRVFHFQCAVCKYKTKCRLPVGKKVGLLRCSKCKECTPVVPPPDGKLYGRCAFCQCLIVYSPTAKALVCPRETCKNVLFCSAANGKMMRKVPCEVCGYVMRIIKDPRDLLSTNLQVCSQCGEANTIGPAPAGKMYTRCPYCNALFKHNVSIPRVRCPRVTCKKVVEVGDGEKQSLVCLACKNTIFYYGNKKIVVCGFCESTIHTGELSTGKKHIRCSCSALLIVDKGVHRVKCPMKNCGKVIVTSSESTKNVKNPK